MKPTPNEIANRAYEKISAGMDEYEGKGVCLSCGSENDEEWIEPDSEDRRCYFCDEMQVIAWDQAIIKFEGYVTEEG